MKVPFLDLKKQYASIKPEIQAAMEQVLDSCAFAGGPFVQTFEEEFARFCGVPHAIGVSDGTSALLLILRAMGIGPGDEVITVSSTFAATAEAIRLAGATPVFVDIDGRTYTMDPESVQPAITLHTRAILPVHLFGQMADMAPIMAIAEAHGLAVIEDACQAHGAEYRGKRAGTFGIAAAFSFYPGKNLGAYGEAGAVTTRSAELAEKVRMLRDHGQSRKYFHDILGWNARMDGMQGAVLSVKLRHLDAWNAARRKNALAYVRGLQDLEGVVLPRQADYARHVYHVYAVRVRERDRMLAALTERGIGCGIHYPVPVHLQQAFSDLPFPRGSLPVTERCADQFLSLPMYAELGQEEIDAVSAAVAELAGEPVAV
jgi:dTDP-4-amino-4,6-dideoxygalactose transaminase